MVASNKNMMRHFHVACLSCVYTAAAMLSGCQLVTNFDRGKIPSDQDAGLMTGSGSGSANDGGSGEDATPDPVDAGDAG